MTKRNLFEELKEGIEALADERAGKLTLRKCTVEYQAAPEVTAQDVVAVRSKLHVSRTVFARYLRTNPRTVEGWEQGRAKPNAQAALLIKLVDKYPETVEHLATI